VPTAPGRRSGGQSYATETHATETHTTKTYVRAGASKRWRSVEPHTIGVVKNTRIALCQLNFKVGALEANTDRAIEALNEAEAAGADLAVFSELGVCGYPPEDLVLKHGFIDDQLAELERFAAATSGIRCAAVIGFVERADGLFNSAAMCADGHLVGTYQKRALPNYAVFDEERYFTPGHAPLKLYDVAGVRTGLVICEDAWVPDGPIVDLGAGGAELIISINGSPYHRNKMQLRERTLATRAADAASALVYVNIVGGQDEIVFDGASLVFDSVGNLVARAAQFKEEVMILDLDIKPTLTTPLFDPRHRSSGDAFTLLPISEPRSSLPEPARPPVITYPVEEPEELWQALVLATRDYVTKNGFREVVIGMSGGIDSTICAVIAADALGPENVHGVSMPSRYSSDHSKSDAELLCENLGVDFRTIAIEDAHKAFETILAPSFEGTEPDVTEENLQSRIRGVLLMALSNKHGWMVLTTGNKSETAVGYSTLYGDTAGGYACIKDVPKTVVYELCRDYNRRAAKEIIPVGVIDKPPSAELRPDQRDDQSLPPYEELDPIIEAYVEGDGTIDSLIADGFDPDTVRRIIGLIDRAEYKRRQSPPGARITPKAFGRDRRLPITNGYK